MSGNERVQRSFSMM